MAIPTVNELALILMREAGEVASNAALVAQYESWIQDIFDDIGIACKWRYLWEMNSLTTVDGTALYTLDGVLDQEISAKFVDDTNSPLRMGYKQDLMNRGLNLDLAGKPQYWIVEEYDSDTEKFTTRLWPVPDAVYEISFLGILQPQELTSTTKLTFPRRFISTIKHGVRALSREDDEKYDGADRAESRYKLGLRQLIKGNTLGAYRPQMQIQDIPSTYPQFVKLPPDHFRN